MTFSEQLNEYLSILNCSAKELSQISGLSNSLLRISCWIPALAQLLLKRRKALSKVSFSFTITFDILHPTSLQSLQVT